MQQREKPTGSYADSTDPIALARLENNVYVLYNENLFSSVKEYSVSLTIGYATNAIPADLQQICADRAYELFLQSSKSTASRFGVTSVTTQKPEHSITTAFKTLSDELKTRLKPYRRIPV